MTWAAIDMELGPDLSDFVCPSAGAVWGVMRYEYFVESTGGLHIDITSDACETGDLAAALGEIAEWLEALGDA